MPARSQPLQVLVVDDEESQGRIIATVLERRDCYVDLSFSGEDAYRRIIEEPGRYHVVVTDIVMPGMSGIELIRAVRESELPVALLSITGYELTHAALQELRDHGVPLFVKPMDMDDLYAAIVKEVDQLAGT